MERAETGHAAGQASIAALRGLQNQSPGIGSCGAGAVERDEKPVVHP